MMKRNLEKIGERYYITKYGFVSDEIGEKLQALGNKFYSWVTDMVKDNWHRPIPNPVEDFRIVFYNDYDEICDLLGIMEGDEDIVSDYLSYVADICNVGD